MHASPYLLTTRTRYRVCLDTKQPVPAHEDRISTRSNPYMLILAYAHPYISPASPRPAPAAPPPPAPARGKAPRCGPASPASPPRPTPAEACEAERDLKSAFRYSIGQSRAAAATHACQAWPMGGACSTGRGPPPHKFHTSRRRQDWPMGGALPLCGHRSVRIFSLPSSMGTHTCP